MTRRCAFQRNVRERGGNHGMRNAPLTHPATTEPFGSVQWMCTDELPEAISRSNTRTTTPFVRFPTVSLKGSEWTYTFSAFAVTDASYSTNVSAGTGAAGAAHPFPRFLSENTINGNVYSSGLTKLLCTRWRGVLTYTILNTLHRDGSS